MSSTPIPTAQDRFNEKYISSREILQRLKVTRPTISKARARGILPDPIIIHDTLIYLWERETVTPFLDAWELLLNAKRANRQ